MMFPIKLALRYLGGRKLRTTLTTLAIAIAVLLIYGMNLLLPVFLESFQSSAMAISGETDMTITHKTGDPFDAAILDQVSGVEGVVTAMGAYERTINLPADFVDHDSSTQDRIAIVNIVGVDPDVAAMMVSYRINNGRYLTNTDASSALISESYAEAASLAVGDTLHLPTPTGMADFSIVGLLPKKVGPGNEQVIIPLAEAQRLYNVPGKINRMDANFNTANDAERAVIQQRIVVALGDNYKYGVIPAGAELMGNIRTAQVMMNFFAVMGLLMGGFIIFNTFRTIIAERRRDIGMLRALGASRKTIYWTILVEGMIQGILGSVLGIILGYLFGLLTSYAAGIVVKRFLNITISSSLSLQPGLMLLSAVLGIGITLLAGLIPAQAATRITPLEALRPTVGKVTLRRLASFGFWLGLASLAASILLLVFASSDWLGIGALLLVVSLVLLTPVLVNPIANLFSRIITLLSMRDGTAQLAEGNISRQPTRAAITAATSLVSTAVLIIVASVISSVIMTFSRVMENSLGSDYLFIPPSVALWSSDVGTSPEFAEQLRAIPGVTVVSTMRFAGSQIGDAAVGLLGIDPQYYTQTSGLRFASGDPDAAYAAINSGKTIILNGILSGQIKAKVGDDVEVMTINGKQTYRVVGIGSDYLNAKTATAYISQANIAADFAKTEDIFLQVNVDPKADVEPIEAAFKQALANYPQFTLYNGKEYLKENTNLLNAAFSVVILLGLFLAIPSLLAMINTLTIGVLERTREIGMLRAVGALRKQVRRMVLIEALLLSGIGTAIGLLAGLYFGYLSVQAFANLGFPADYLFPWSGIVIALAVGLVFGALSAVLPARQAARMDVVEALRYE
jgi:putative ABC transport system permease protein